MNVFLNQGHYRGQTALDLVAKVDGTDLSCAFPFQKGLRGACTTLADLDRHGLDGANSLFVSSKADAVKMIVAVNYSRPNALGRGSKAQKRCDRFGIVMTEHGLGTILPDGRLQTAFQQYWAPKQKRAATCAEASAYMENRAAVARDLIAYYDSRTFTGD